MLGLTQVKNLGYNKKQYIFQWIESIDEDSQELLYTMVAFDQTEQQVIPIKTVRQGEELRAVIGSTKIVDGKGIIFYSDTFTDTPKNIRVFAMDEHGNIVSSNILAVDFNNPVVTELHHMEYLQERLAREGLNEVEIHVQQEDVYKRQGMGTGVVVIGLASIIIGEMVFKRIPFMASTTVVILGSILYKASTALALRMGLSLIHI